MSNQRYSPEFKDEAVRQRSGSAKAGMRGPHQGPVADGAQARGRTKVSEGLPKI